MSWTEVRVLVAESPDDALLVDVVAPLIESLRARIRRWHHAWEPDLWIRIQWRSDEDAKPGMELVREALDRAGHSWRFDVYDHAADAAMMGEEMAEIFDADMQRGSERALAIARHEREGTLTKDRDCHWARFMHTNTNQLYGTWADEYRLCLEQARYRAWLLSCGKHTDRDALAPVVERLDALLAEVDALAQAETAQLDAWREAGRPEITEMFEFPETFSRKPADNR